MVIKRKYAIEHKDGYFITARHEPTYDEDKAARFHTVGEANHFYKESHYRVSDPENYTVVPIKITYERDVDHANTESGTEES
ncbi:hypothetical protein [Paenibacillus oleatilyticus]|uniref:Uncharacterized protein n=1 Tax=Paenibacillus oleatilyticus TaxID=2594886 RepID=A0ABV4VCC2_9BACL